MTDWFRSWHNAPTDPKWLLIARKANTTPIVVSAIFWALLDHASQEAERGSVVTFDQETYAAWAGIDESEVAAVIQCMTDKSVIADGRLTSWEKRQPKREDDSSQRVKAFRARTAAPAEPETHGNADVTQRNAPEEIRGDTEESREEPEDPRVTAPDVEPPVPDLPEVEDVTDTPYAVYVAFLDEIGTAEDSVAPRWKQKQIGIAARLIEQGFGEDKVRRCTRFMRSQSWRTSPFDLGNVEKYIGTWEANGSPEQELSKAEQQNVERNRTNGQPDHLVKKYEHLFGPREGRAAS